MSQHSPFSEQWPDSYAILDKHGLNNLVDAVDDQTWLIRVSTELAAAAGARNDALAEQAAEIMRLKEENEVLSCRDQTGAVVQNYYDIGRELDAQGSPFDAVMALKARADRAEAELAAEIAKSTADYIALALERDTLEIELSDLKHTGVELTDEGLIPASETIRRLKAELAALRAAPIDAQREQDIATVRNIVNWAHPDSDMERAYAALDRLAALPSRDEVLEEAAEPLKQLAAIYRVGKYPNTEKARDLEHYLSLIRALKSPPTLQAAKEAP